MEPLDRLLEKFSKWLQQQPEFPLLFLSDRATRKRASAAVAKTLMRIPTRKPSPPPVKTVAQKLLEDMHSDDEALD